MKRVIEVEVTGLIRMEVDDEVASDRDGKKVLEIHERTPEVTQRECLAAMAYSLSVLGSWDGYADFEHAKYKGLAAYDFIDGPEFGKVTIDDKVII